MPTYDDALGWLDSQQDAMTETLVAWAKINTGTFNRRGVNELSRLVEAAFENMIDAAERREPGKYEVVNEQGGLTPVLLGENLHLIRRPSAERRVLLAIHLDTVYPESSPFQDVELIDTNTLRGPGVADAKGGLVVMLFALRAFERFVAATGLNSIGWNVVLNSDEEIGSPGSRGLLREVAQSAELGLLFEPAHQDGRIVSSRKGSANFSLLFRGRAAHSGRDFHAGRNAMVSASRTAVRIHELNGRWSDVTLNVARIDGGGAYNVVPDLGIVRVNVRYPDASLEEEIRSALVEVADGAAIVDETVTTFVGEFASPPKHVDASVSSLLHQFHQCGSQLGMDLKWRPVGGACDGNRLAAFGLPNLDSLGARGGDLHQFTEFVSLDSLTERAKLTALFLMKLADGTLPGLKT